jgi:glutathione S-transferase
MLKLHAAPNTISAASAIALAEAGLAFEVVPVNFDVAQQTKPAYLAINPKGRVPALEAPEGILTETGAILEYAAALAPEAGLIPADPWAAAQMRAVMHYLGTSMHVDHAHRMRGYRWASQESSFDDMRARVPDNMKACCAYLESSCALSPYLMSSGFTLADAWAFPITCWLADDGVTLSDYPRLQRFSDTMKSRASVQAVYDQGLLT